MSVLKPALEIIDISIYSTLPWHHFALMLFVVMLHFQIVESIFIISYRGFMQHFATAVKTKGFPDF